jgi:hypothetical protein
MQLCSTSSSTGSIEGTVMCLKAARPGLAIVFWAIAWISTGAAAADPQAGFIYAGTRLSAEDAGVLASTHPTLTLSKLQDVSQKVAEALADNEAQGDTYLTLPSVLEISGEAARALSRRQGILRLWGLASLSPEVAAALGEHQGRRVELPNVKEISIDVATRLAECKRHGLVLGITSLPPDMAIVLSKYDGDLFLNGLESLSLDAALALSEHRKFLDLSGARVTREVAAALLRHEGGIGISEVAKLEPGVGDVLAKHSREVFVAPEEFDSVALVKRIASEPSWPAKMRRVRTMTPEIARAYVEGAPWSMYLPSLASLSPEAASELAKGSGSLSLPGMEDITPKVARALLDRTDSVKLIGVKKLIGADGLAVAKAIAEARAPVTLQNLSQASPEVLEELSRRATIVLPDRRNVTIVP